ncbi:hypothetical protein [Streptomyces sp. NPDC001480]|uniref:hypothetical protein n=1 Tax=Streptomyces sp. NPDC001480 TaxID=3364577 RepID=UPI0036BA64C9
MSGSELTLGAVPAHLEEEEREIAAQAEATRGRIAELTARLEEFDRVAEEIRITGKSLLARPDPLRWTMRFFPASRMTMAGGTSDVPCPRAWCGRRER